MTTPRNYCDALCERFQLISQGRVVARHPHQENERGYFIALPIYPKADSKPLFVPLETIWGKLLASDAILKNDTLGPAELLGVSRINVGLIEETFYHDAQQHLFVQASDDTKKYCDVNPLPPYHDYDALAAYTWAFWEEGRDSASFAVYEFDCFLYWVIKTPLTFQLFVPSLIQQITKICAYSPAETDHLFAVFVALHRALISSTTERRVQ